MPILKNLKNQTLANNNIESDPDKFYQEIDEQNSHRSCCTCQTMIIFFVVLFLLLASLIFFIYYKVTRDKIMPFNNTTVVSLDQLIAKINKPTTNPDGRLQITLSNQELNTLLSEGLTAQNFVLKDIQTAIFPNQILIYGVLTKPIGSKVVMQVVPKVQNGQIKFNVEKLTAGNFNLPGFFNDSIGNILTNSINSKLTLIYQNFYVEEVKLEENKIIIIGKEK